MITDDPHPSLIHQMCPGCGCYGVLPCDVCASTPRAEPTEADREEAREAHADAEEDTDTSPDPRWSPDEEP